MTLLETMFFLSIIQMDCPSFLDYTEGVAKVDIELMNIEQQETVKVTLFHQKTPLMVSHRPPCQISSVISCHHGGNSFPEQLKNLMPIVRNISALGDRKAVEEKTTNSGKIIKQVLLRFNLNK